MAIGFRASSAAGATSSSQVSSQAVTIPASVAAGDVLVVLGVQVPISSVTPTLSIASTGTAPVAAAAQQSASESLPATLGARPWTVVCGAGDAGKVITVSSTTTGFWSVAVAAYTGVDNTNPVDVAGGAVTTGGNTGTVTCPSESTVTAGDWAVYLGGGAAEGATLTGPTGSTSRESSVASGIDVYAAVNDSNASAGAAGSSIGGGTFTTNVATNSILAAFTIGLKAAGSGVAGSAAFTGTGTWSAGVADAGAGAWSGKGTLSASVAGAGAAAWGGTGSLAGAEQVTLASGAAMTGTGTLTATGEDVPVFSAVFESTAGDGTQTWSVTSALNGPGTSTLRILPPSSPSGSYPHSFLFALPVSTGTDATYGDPIAVIGDDLGAHNAYNTTVVVPSFPIQPWYADNPDNAQQSQESFMLALANWMSTSSFASGGEKNYLIGFSKSGIGGQGLMFHRPDVWAACASWDAPFMMTDYDGTDPTFGQTVGGDPADCYGTSANFTTNYELSAAHLAAWAPGGSFTTQERLWIGGYYAFQADVNAYMSELTTAGILYNGGWNTEDASHAWHDDWVSSALAAIMAMPASQSGAAFSGSGTFGAAPRFAPPAPLSGTGSFTAGSQLPAATGWGGTSAFTAGSRLPAAAGWAGAGALAAGPQLPAAAGWGGTSAFAATGQLPGGAALDGEGTWLAGPQVQGTAGWAGTSAFTAAPQSPAGAAFSGEGTLLGGPQLPAAASWAGTSAFTAATGSQSAGTAAFTGLGLFGAAGQFPGSAGWAGTGGLSLAGLQPSAAGWAGAGSLGTAPALPGSAGWTGSGGFAAVTGLAQGALFTGLGTLEAPWTVAGPAGAAFSGEGLFAGAYAQDYQAAGAWAGLGTLAVTGSSLTGTPGTCLAADYPAYSALAADYPAYSVIAADRGG
jgi:hypothetical protein